MNIIRNFLAGAAATILVGACKPDAQPSTDVANVRVPAALPILFRLPSDTPPPVLVPTSGTLRLDGQCLYLDGPPQKRALILWRAGTTIAREGDKLVVREGPTAATDPAPRLVVGTAIIGAGGVRDFTREQIMRMAEPDPPAACGTRIASLVMIEPDQPRRTVRAAVATSEASRPPPPPPPPPPHPPPPSLTQRAKEGGIPIIASSVILGYSNPRTALLAYLVDYYRDRDGYRGLHVCIDADSAALDALKRRSSRLKPKVACEWRNGLVVLRANGETAMMLHARVDCAGGACTGEGGYAIGNLGAASNAFRLVRRGDGWLIHKLGLEIIA